MKLKIAVCDDNKLDQDYVIKLLQEYANENGVILEIQAFISAEQFLFQYVDEKDYQILVLDIEMEKMNGVELAKKLREDNKEIQIFFVTGFSDYISEGYDRGSYQKRNEWMIDHASMVIAGYTGAAGGTRNTIEYAKKQVEFIIKYLNL